MEKIIFTTIYDEVLHKMETIGFNAIDLKQASTSGVISAVISFEDRSDGSLKIVLTNSESLRREKSELNYELDTREKILLFLKLSIQKNIMFTAQDIIIYRILLAHFINNQVNGVATISLDKIHKLYRGKTISYNKDKRKYDDETLQAYINTFNKLSLIVGTLDFNRSNLKVAKQYSKEDVYSCSGPLLTISKNVNCENITTTEFRYSLGKIGDYFIKSNQYGQLLSQEIYSLRFNQIDTFNISIYIGRMIIINRCRKRKITIHISTLLNRIMKYDRKGYSTGLTYLEYLTKLDAVKRNKKLKYIEKQLNYVLDLLKEKNSIQSYKYNLSFKYKYIKDGELSVQILIGKKDNGNG